MLLENWTPGFIPNTVKAGQILLGIGAGLLFGNLKMLPPSKGVTTGLMLLLSGLGLGFGTAFFMDGSLTLILLFSLTLISGGAVAGNLTHTYLIPFAAWLCFFTLGLSSLPSGGHFPASASVVLANIIGLICLIGGATTLSHWATHRQADLWPKIGVRILGSWLLAIAVLMLTFEYKTIVF